MSQKSPSNQITPVLAQTLRFIRDFTERRHYPPLYAEMLAGLGLASKCSAKARVDRLRDLGLLTYKDRCPRSIVLTEQGKELAQ